MPATENTDSMNAFDWVDEYADELFRYASSRVRDVATAEDLVQDTLVAALRNTDSFAGGSSVSTWLVGILKHKIIDHYRQQKLWIDLGDDDDLFDERGHWRHGAEPQAWNRRTPEDDLENAQLAVVLQLALRSIPRSLSTVFSMHEIEGLTRDEICELLGLSDSNYWVMLHRARLRLRHEVERRWPNAEDSVAHPLVNMLEAV